jgi:hypothetical protein
MKPEHFPEHLVVNERPNTQQDNSPQTRASIGVRPEHLSEQNPNSRVFVRPPTP